MLPENNGRDEALGRAVLARQLNCFEEARKIYQARLFVCFIETCSSGFGTYSALVNPQFHGEPVLPTRIVKRSLGRYEWLSAAANQWLGKRRKSPSGHIAGRRYLEITARDPMIHKSVARAVNGCGSSWK